MLSRTLDLGPPATRQRRLNEASKNDELGEVLGQFSGELRRALSFYMSAPV